MSIAVGILADAIAHTRRASNTTSRVVADLVHVLTWCVGVVYVDYAQM